MLVFDGKLSGRLLLERSVFLTLRRGLVLRATVGFFLARDAVLEVRLTDAAFLADFLTAFAGDRFGVFLVTLLAALLVTFLAVLRTLFLALLLATFLVFAVARDALPLLLWVRERDADFADALSFAGLAFRVVVFFPATFLVVFFLFLIAADARLPVAGFFAFDGRAGFALPVLLDAAGLADRVGDLTVFFLATNSSDLTHKKNAKPLQDKG